MTHLKRLALVALSSAALATAVVAAPARAVVPRSFASRQTSTIAAGVTYTRIIDRSVPLRTYVVTLDPSRAASLDVQTAGSTFGRYSPTSAIASSAGAIAGINGDFTNDGMPVHAFAEDGAIKTAGRNIGATFAISKNEANLYLRSGVKPVITGVNGANGKSFTVEQWNSDGPGNGEIAAFSAAGGAVEKPPSGACSARLLPSGPYRWATSQRGVVRDFTVDAVQCQSDPMAVGGGIVLAANRYNFRAEQIKDMVRGKSVTLTWDVESWAGVTDVVGGAPQLLANGRVVADNNCGTYFCARNPRAGIGYTADGKILLVVVDGRSSSSVGVTPVAFANTFKALGASSALNLDGGGGATMWVKGKGVVNVPSDGAERPVTNAVLVLPGSDKSEPSGLAPTRRALVTPSQASAAQAASLADPASTGGLLEAYGS
jgi:Phosphodiester glycosidase